jgi:cytochrome b561
MPAPVGVSSARDLLHPAGEYSRAAKWFHWLTVLPLIVLLLSGPSLHLFVDEAKFRFYTVHESLGLLVLVLAAARLTWRLRHRPPDRTYLPDFERRGSDAVHVALYVTLIVQPILGFFTTNAYGFPQQGATAFLGFIDLPKFMEASPSLALRLHWAHAIVGGLIVVLAVAHISGVLYHHIVTRDGTLLRMI